MRYCEPGSADMARDDSGPPNNPGPRTNDPGPIETGPVTKRAGGTGITVGDIRGTNVTIGHGSSASANLRQPSAQRDLVALFDEFIALLERHQNSVADAADIRESAVAARDELARRSPRWHVVRGLLMGIAASVADVSELAGAIDNIQAMVAHMST